MAVPRWGCKPNQTRGEQTSCYPHYCRAFFPGMQRAHAHCGPAPKFRVLLMNQRQGEGGAQQWMRRFDLLQFSMSRANRQAPDRCTHRSACVPLISSQILSRSRPRAHDTLFCTSRSYCHPDYKAEDEPDYLFPMAAKDFCGDVRGQAVIGACPCREGVCSPPARRNQNISSTVFTTCRGVCPSQPLYQSVQFTVGFGGDVDYVGSIVSRIVCCQRP